MILIARYCRNDVVCTIRSFSERHSETNVCRRKRIDIKKNRWELLVLNESLGGVTDPRVSSFRARKLAIASMMHEFRERDVFRLGFRAISHGQNCPTFPTSFTCPVSASSNFEDSHTRESRVDSSGNAKDVRVLYILGKKCGRINTKNIIIVYRIAVRSLARRVDRAETQGTFRVHVVLWKLSDDYFANRSGLSECVCMHAWIDMQKGKRRY